MRQALREGRGGEGAPATPTTRTPTSARALKSVDSPLFGAAAKLKVPLGKDYEYTGRENTSTPALGESKPTNRNSLLPFGLPVPGAYVPNPVSEPLQLARVTRWLMLAGVRDLMDWHRTASCFRIVLFEKSGVNGVPVKGSKNSARFDNLNACGDVHVCPVCNVRIAAKRESEVALVLKAHLSGGGRAIHIVQTFRHDRFDHLPDLLNKLATARRKMHASREYKKFCKDWGYVGYIRALEITHSDKNGWHPHVHQLFLTNDSYYLSYFPRFKAQYFKMWKKYALAAGLTSYEDACTFDLASDDIESVKRLASYFTDDGLECNLDILDDEKVELNNMLSDLNKKVAKKSSAAKELTLQAGKLAKSESMTPMQLLKEYAIHGDTYAGALFIEYAEAFKNKKQLVFSKGLKMKYNLKDLTDQEIAESPLDKNEQMLGFISRGEWKAILFNFKGRGEILKRASTQDWSEVAEYIEHLYLEYVNRSA